MNIGSMYTEAEAYVQRFHTRNPYELLDSIGAIVIRSYEYEPDGLKGFSTISKRSLFAVINGHLNDVEQRIVAGHEAAHLILHKREILASSAQTLKDFDLFRCVGKLERQANSFLADFLVSDDEVANVLTSENTNYFNASRELMLPPPLFAFKLYSMMHRGHSARNPVDLQSSVLGKSENW